MSRSQGQRSATRSQRCWCASMAGSGDYLGVGHVGQHQPDEVGALGQTATSAAASSSAVAVGSRCHTGLLSPARSAWMT